MGTLADLVRHAGPAYLDARAGRLSGAQRRALADIADCRTAAMGGTVLRCDTCGARTYHYHSCRNRHCPTCQEDRAQDWLARTQARLLPCDHYLLTFTLPSALRSVARQHPRIVYDALLREAAAAVLTLANDRQWVGGMPGILAVLHTWSRTLEYHPHVHLLVTAGGLAADRTTWIKPAHARFLMPGYALSPVFRAKMHTALARAGLDAAIDPRVWERRWTVHVQAIGTGQHAALYLSRYIYRVALTDQRIERVSNGQVTFKYTHARTGETRRVTLPVDHFLDRFLAHVLPRGFSKVRSYGLLSPGRRGDLDRARGILVAHRTAAALTSTLAPSSPPPLELPVLMVAMIAGALALRCPRCVHGQYRVEAHLQRPMRGARPPPR
ncbi:MAG: IS91 family transposase [bacterium]